MYWSRDEANADVSDALEIHKRAPSLFGATLHSRD
jgi:hypothetical protein